MEFDQPKVPLQMPAAGTTLRAREQLRDLEPRADPGCRRRHSLLGRCLALSSLCAFCLFHVEAAPCKLGALHLAGRIFPQAAVGAQH